MTQCSPDTCLTIRFADKHAGTLQVFRAVEALSETDWHLHTSSRAINSWGGPNAVKEAIRGLSPVSDSRCVTIDLHIDHKRPTTGFKGFSRPLIFPE